MAAVDVMMNIAAVAHPNSLKPGLSVTLQTRPCKHFPAFFVSPVSKVCPSIFTMYPHHHLYLRFPFAWICGAAYRCVAAVQSACHAVADACRAQADASCPKLDIFLQQAHQVLINKLFTACLLRLSMLRFFLLLSFFDPLPCSLIA